MARRIEKLVIESALKEYSNHRKIRVPVSQIFMSMDFNGISRTTIERLKVCYGFWERSENKDIYLSLFPSWLDPAGLNVQTVPSNWAYLGEFPYGKWMSNVS